MSPDRCRIRIDEASTVENVFLMDITTGARKVVELSGYELVGSTLTGNTVFDGNPQSMAVDAEHFYASVGNWYTLGKLSRSTGALVASKATLIGGSYLTAAWVFEGNDYLWQVRGSVVYRTDKATLEPVAFYDDGAGRTVAHIAAANGRIFFSSYDTDSPYGNPRITELTAAGGVVTSFDETTIGAVGLSASIGANAAGNRLVLARNSGVTKILDTDAWTVAATAPTDYTFTSPRFSGTDVVGALLFSSPFKILAWKWADSLANIRVLDVPAGTYNTNTVETH